MEQYKKFDKELSHLVNDNIRKLESIFPSVIKDGQVDFEELKELLGDFEEVDKEKYELNWVGKKEAKRIALEPVHGKTLKYIQGSGKNENTTENLYIEGDNLEVLKLLQGSYYGKIKIIYIDPPYNTGNDFIYSDIFKENKNQSEIKEGNVDENSERLVKTQKSSSFYHSNWMNMMYSRLLTCKNLLRDDGAIFISIDDNEIWNLKKICDEVFGEYNFIADFIIESNPRGSQSSKHIANVHEYLLMYGKDAKCINIQGFKKEDKNLSEYKEEDNIGKYRLLGLRQRGGEWRREQRPNMYYPIYVNPLNKKVSLEQSNQYSIEVLPKRPNGEESRWTWGKDKFAKNNDLLIGKIVRRNGDEDVWDIFRKDYLLDINGNEKTQKPKSIWNDKEINYQNGRNDIKSLFSNSEIFDFPKPMVLIEKIIRILDEKECIIMDFFSGSATTANAIMKLNAQDMYKRKYILVQLCEDISENTQARKAGYKNICEIGKKRIIMGGNKIVEENKDNPNIKNLDIGFKVFKVDNSNIKWEKQIDENNQFKYDLDGIDADDMDFMPNTKDIDVVYEILLRQYGIPLTAKIDKLDFIGERTYTIENSIIVCLENKITKDIIDKISELEPIKVIFRDSAFGEDISLKQNCIHRLNVLIEKNNKNNTHVVEFI